MSKIYVYENHAGFPEDMFLADHELSDEERFCTACNEYDEFIAEIEDFNQLVSIMHKHSIYKGSEDFNRLKKLYHSIASKQKKIINMNEYWDDNKRYIRNIKKCLCLERIGNNYKLECRIMQRGEHIYTFIKGNEYICKNNDNLLWLCDSAKETVESSVKAFDSLVEKAKSEFTEVFVKELNSFLYIGHETGSHYSMIVEKRSGLGKVCVYYNQDVEDLIRSLAFEFSLSDDLKEVFNELFESNKDTIARNPLYIAALSSGDKTLQKLLKLHYNIATKGECSWLEKLFGYKILPALPKEYDRDYYVDSDTIKGSVLGRSGYTILHRPYFAMQGSTHSIWTLNPYRKRGVDAAKTDVSSISFSDYLELFEEVEELK